MQLTESILNESRELLKEKDFGVLSTISVHLDGIPFGSVANYCLDDKGHPLLLISDIAQHAINAKADPRCSITVLEQSGGNVQSESRITISGNLIADDSDLNKERYELYFPESKSYHDFHDFTVFRLVPISVRYIGGFGKIFWIEPVDFYSEPQMKSEAKQFIIEHMNDHHADSLVDYARYYKGVEADNSTLMIGIDSGGIDMLQNGKKLRIQSTEQIKDAQKAREILVSMAKKASTRSS
ncbi:MAG: DUF2470 domain-containing protein [Flavobacteriales bacterium]|nr:DUF2470 domain-containing protein [Flavobacteriales bacterium]